MQYHCEYCQINYRRRSHEEYVEYICNAIELESELCSTAECDIEHSNYDQQYFVASSQCAHHVEAQRE